MQAQRRAATLACEGLRAGKSAAFAAGALARAFLEVCLVLLQCAAATLACGGTRAGRV